MTLRRSAFKSEPKPRKPRKELIELPDGALKKMMMQLAGIKVAKPMNRTRMKTRSPKMTAIRKSAKGKDCTFRIVGVCNWNPETTVWCHSNESVDGKGAGLKARDEEGAYGCSACHAYYDGGYVGKMSRDDVRLIFNAARILSRSFLEMEGLAC